jgi:hypothetical protein
MLPTDDTIVAELNLRLGVRSREAGHHGLLRSVTSIDTPLPDGCVPMEAKLEPGFGNSGISEA